MMKLNPQVVTSMLFLSFLVNPKSVIFNVNLLLQSSSKMFSNFKFLLNKLKKKKNR
jgi:hypothetical protein